LNQHDILKTYIKDSKINELCELLQTYQQLHIQIDGCKGSVRSIIYSSIHNKLKYDKLIILNHREEAEHVYNDLESFVETQKILWFPSAFKNENSSPYFSRSQFENCSQIIFL